MVKSEYKHSYAAQYIRDSTNFRIIANGKEILTIPKEVKIFDDSTPLKTGFDIGSVFSLPGETIRISYPELQQMGFGIVSVKVVEKFHFHQNRTYKIAPLNFFPKNAYLDEVPREHTIQYDLINEAIWLEGENAGKMRRGEPTFVKKRTSNGGRDALVYDHEKKMSDFIEGFRNSNSLDTKTVSYFMNVSEIPVIMTNRGELACIDYKDGDIEPKVGVVGSSGTGKSLMKDCITSHVSSRKNKRPSIIEMNDIQNEMDSAALPWRKEDTRFTLPLSLINETTRPMPIVLITPHTSELNEIDYEGEINYRVSYPYTEIFKEGLKHWMRKDKESAKGEGLGKSQHYFESASGLLQECKTLAELKETLFRLEAKDKDSIAFQRSVGQSLPEGTGVKVMNVLSSLFKKQIFDVTTQYPSKWTVQEYDPVTGDVLWEDKFYPLTACAVVGVVGVLRVEHLWEPKDFKPFFELYLNDLLIKQEHHKAFKDTMKSIWISIDEFTAVLEAYDLVDMLMSRGRQKRLGVIWMTQHYTKIPDSIITNSDYIFTFQQRNVEAAKKICQDAGLTTRGKDSDVEVLRQLEPLNAMGIARTKPFKVYKPDGTHYYSTRIVGRIVPPLCRHRVPKQN